MEALGQQRTGQSSQDGQRERCLELQGTELETLRSIYSSSAVRTLPSTASSTTATVSISIQIDLFEAFRGHLRTDRLLSYNNRSDEEQLWQQQLLQHVLIGMRDADNSEGQNKRNIGKDVMRNMEKKRKNQPDQESNDE
ncbi:hypothetical protein MJO28_003010 [Puccinia striiformis f. sp. tritici]|nr:hypothetical protein MJO28_003010 [Puccinia striiformis f. sp. tritici]